MTTQSCTTLIDHATEAGESSLARRTIPQVPEVKSRAGQRVYDSIVDLIANPDNPTPMVRLSGRFNPEPGFEMFVKLEGFNPFGSIKDRAALYMIRGTALREDQVLVEPSAGNTGIALAAISNAEGKAVEIAVPDGTPEEKKALLRFLGAELHEIEDELCPLFPTEGARGVVKSLVESAAFNGKYVSPNQYENELNVEAHYHTTGPEIWNQTNGEIDYFFAAFGTCGTITGVGRYLKERNPDIKIIGIEPASRNHHLSGIKKISNLPEEYAPKILDPSRVFSPPDSTLTFLSASSPLKRKEPRMDRTCFRTSPTAWSSMVSKTVFLGSIFSGES